jgi:hypothetical protein
MNRISEIQIPTLFRLYKTIIWQNFWYIIQIQAPTSLTVPPSIPTKFDKTHKTRRETEKEKLYLGHMFAELHDIHPPKLFVVEANYDARGMFGVFTKIF